MDPYLCNVEQHSRYLVFRFTLDGDGKVELHHKRFFNMEWGPSGKGVHVIVVSTHYTQTHAYSWTHTQTHAHKQTHAHTHTHTHMHTHHAHKKHSQEILFIVLQYNRVVQMQVMLLAWYHDVLTNWILSTSYVIFPSTNLGCHPKHGQCGRNSHRQCQSWRNNHHYRGHYLDYSLMQSRHPMLELLQKQRHLLSAVILQYCCQRKWCNHQRCEL